MFHIKAIPHPMHTKPFIFFLLVLALPFIVVGQNILLEQDVLADSTVSSFGPNRTNYIHSFISYGLPIAEIKEGADISIGRSSNFNFGFRYKLRASNFYAIGAELFYEFNEFSIKQNDEKFLLDTTINDKERMRFNNLGLGFYNRFNFGRRGDAIGNFIDLGVFGEWVFDLTHVTKNELPDGSKVKVKTRKLGIEEPLAYGVLVRIGFNRFVLFGNYRLSNFFKEKYGYPELPHANAGIQIGFH